MATEKEPVTEQKTPEKKPYTLRELNAKDVFSIARIIGKIGIQNIKKCFMTDDFQKALKSADSEDGKGAEMLGMLAVLDVVGVLMENLPNCEKEMFAFLADMSGLSVSEVQNLDPEHFVEMVVDIVNSERFKGFFKAALRLFK